MTKYKNKLKRYNSKRKSNENYQIQSLREDGTGICYIHNPTISEQTIFSRLGQEIAHSIDSLVENEPISVLRDTIYIGETASYKMAISGRANKRRAYTTPLNGDAKNLLERLYK